MPPKCLVFLAVIKLIRCKRLFETIEELSDTYLDILEDVCNIESPTNYKEGVDAVGAYLLNMSEKLHWKTEVYAQKISGNVVCITLNSEAKGEPICLSGHMDTVHAVGAFGSPAVKRDDKYMYGPGVMDCKGGIVAAFLAMDSLDRCGYRSRPIHLILQSDEENGSATSDKATIRYICSKAGNSLAFLNLEGSIGNTAVLQRKGILRYCFTVHGKSLHSARCTEAANAIAEAAYKIIELEKMKDEAGITCNCGVIHGGTVANIVADNCCFYADIRYSTTDELDRAKEKVREITSNTMVAGCYCDLEEVSCRPAMILLEKNADLLSRMNAIYKENGIPALNARACLSGSDAAYITECGIPCVDNIGTEGGGIHTKREYIRIASLAESAKRIAAYIYCV